MIEKRVLATEVGTTTDKSVEESDEVPDAPPDYFTRIRNKYSVFIILDLGFFF